MNESLYAYKGKCISDCPLKTFRSDVEVGNKTCKDCYSNCLDCLEKGNFTDMKCFNCSEDKIKNEQNCLIIYDNETKEFYNPENETEIVSCLQFYNKYIIENTTECIEEPKEGYFISNNITGLLSPCHFSCRTCSNKKIDDNSNCIECANDYYPKYGENLNNCYSNYTISKGYFLDKKNTSFNWKKCYEICDECDDEGNSTNMNCLSCLELSNNLSSSYIFKLTENKNCIKKCKSDYFLALNGDCVKICPNGTLEFDLNKTCLEFCPKFYEINEEQNKCLKIPYDKMSHTEFKDLFLTEMNELVDSSVLINGTDFLAVVSSSDDISPQEQAEKGISGVDLDNCTEILKEYYNISKDESLIILNMEIKRNGTKINDEKELNDNTFDVGKNSQIEIYDYSGRNLELSICKEDIKILKYIGDLQEELNIDSAKNLANNGIDIFDASDKYFNSICHEYDNHDSKDVIINDRRNDIYKNVSFCDRGCSYEGMNYDLMIANCICNTSIMKYNSDNNTNNDNNKIKEIVDFDFIKKSVIANLLDFNLDVIYCYNLVFNINILKQNIGFYCMLILCVMQIICFFIYLSKKLKPIQKFMLIFNKSYKKVSLFYPPPKFNEENAKQRKLEESNDTKSSNYYVNNFFIKENNFNERQLINGDNKKLEIIEKKNIKKILKKRRRKNPKQIKENKEEKNFIINNNFSPIINIKSSIITINNEIKKNIIPQKEIKLEPINDYIYKYINNLKNNNKMNSTNKIIKCGKISINNLETTKEKKKLKNKKHIFNLYGTYEDIQDMSYENAILYDKRTYLGMYWSFLIDIQII